MNPQQISQVRSFNRSLSKRIGVLNESFLDRGRPLSEARLLFEIGREGTEVRDLRARLGLDSGYVSRLLRSLERQGLTMARAAAGDGRVRRVKLTSKGVRELRELDRRSDAFAESVLASLTAANRIRLVEAMAEVERLTQPFAVSIDAEPPTSGDARRCLNAFFEELAGRFDAGFDPGKSLSASAEELIPPSGALLIARLDGRPIGCAAVRVKDGSIGEIKHLWVDERTRGLGIGRRMLAAIEKQAQQFGLLKVRLDTNRALKEAQALYRSCGYEEVEPFNNEPYAHHWFEKTIS